MGVFLIEADYLRNRLDPRAPRWSYVMADDYDETAKARRDRGDGRVAPHATQASTSGGFASVHAAQAQPASPAPGPGRGRRGPWHAATVSLFASVHAGLFERSSGGAARRRGGAALGEQRRRVGS